MKNLLLASSLLAAAAPAAAASSAVQDPLAVPVYTACLDAERTGVTCLTPVFQSFDQRVFDRPIDAAVRHSDEAGVFDARIRLAGRMLDLRARQAMESGDRAAIAEVYGDWVTHRYVITAAAALPTSDTRREAFMRALRAIVASGGGAGGYENSRDILAAGRRGN